MHKFYLILLLILGSKLSLYSQDAASLYQKGFALLKDNEYEAAKAPFRELISLEKNNYGGYNFLGICHFGLHEYDSTVKYLKLSVLLNKDNIKHSREMTTVRLMRTYICLQNFEAAYELGLQAVKEFPDNLIITKEMQDVCLWAYAINHQGLSSEYLSIDPKEEYTVTNVAQEYLIMRHVRIDDHNLFLIKQRFVALGPYDYLMCGINKTRDSVELKFKLNWDIQTEFGGKEYDFKSVYKNGKFPVWERMGALYKENPELDPITEDKKLRKMK